MKVQVLQREFVYNGIKLPDPGAQLSTEQVRDIHAIAYPELSTSAIEGPEMLAGKAVYRFVRAIGAKG